MTETDQHFSQNGPIHETFSQAYQKLVKNTGDIVGMIAYCIYKRQKKAYVEKLAMRHRTISRRSRRVETFQNDFFNENDIDDLRDAAEHRLSIYVKEFTDEAKNKTYREIAIKQKSDKEDRKSTNIYTWIFGVSTSITATIVVGVFVDLDEYFPSVDPFPDVAEKVEETSPELGTDVFKIEPAAPPRRWNLPVM